MPHMAMGTRENDQAPMWIATSDLPTSPGHPFYTRLNAILDAEGFDRFVEDQCRRFYAAVMGRPSLEPGRYFRLLLVGYFEGIDSERGIAWRAADSLAVRSFLRLGLEDAASDHSTISATRRLIDVETHRAVFTWVRQRLVAAGLLKGRTDRHRRHDVGSQRRDAKYRAPGYGGRLSGLSDPTRRRVGHRDADAERAGAFRSQAEAEEEDIQQGLDESHRSRREGREDEGRPDALDAQSRTWGRSGQRRVGRRDGAGYGSGRHDNARRDGDRGGRTG